MRLSEQDEILGGDLHYFGPIEFDGNPQDYDLAEICGKIILESAKKLKESEMRNQEPDADALEGGEKQINSSSKMN